MKLMIVILLLFIMVLMPTCQAVDVLDYAYTDEVNSTTNYYMEHPFYSGRGDYVTYWRTTFLHIYYDGIDANLTIYCISSCNANDMFLYSTDIFNSTTITYDTEPTINTMLVSQTAPNYPGKMVFTIPTLFLGEAGDYYIALGYEPLDDTYISMDILTRYNITIDTYTDERLPDTNFYASTELLVKHAWYGGVSPYYYGRTYIDLGENRTYPITLTLVALWESSPSPAKIASTSEFDVEAITWNNQPAPLELLAYYDVSYVVGGTSWMYKFTFTPNSRYIVLYTDLSDTTSYTFGSSEDLVNIEVNTGEFVAPYITFSPLSGTSISGTITYTDTDNINYILPYANVNLSSIEYTYGTITDISGEYEIIVEPGQYLLSSSKGNAFSTKSQIVIIPEEGLSNQDLTLNYSKPNIINNGIVGKYFEGNYSHNFKTMNLWENPSFVWGLYNISGQSYIKPCIYASGTIFKCDILDTDIYYEMRFMYSDIYNQNLTKYHPLLTGNRSFVSNIMVASNLQTDQINTILSNRPVAERETYIKGELWDIIFLMLVIFGVILITTFNQKRR